MVSGNTKRLSSKQRFLVFTLTLLTFTMGTSEFVILGILTEISSDLGITVATAGTLVSGFAIAYAVGTPIITAFSSRFKKYPLMLFLILMFILGNIISALAYSYSILIISRVATAVVSGVLIALSMGIANDTMPKVKKPAVIALIFAGFSIANVLGVPMGTFVGQLGSWRLSFWLTALLGVIVLFISMWTIPKNLINEKSSLKEQLSFLTQPRIILAFFIPVFSFAGTYTIYTYITPIVENKLSIPTRFVGMILLAYGVFAIFSNTLSGKIASRNGVGRLRFAFIIQSVILILLYFTMNSVIIGFVNIMLMAVMNYVANATIQLYFMNFAETKSSAVRDFASSLTPVAINIGIALGSLLGGYVVQIGNLVHLSWVGGIEALIAAVVTFIIYRLDNWTVKNSNMKNNPFWQST